MSGGISGTGIKPIEPINCISGADITSNISNITSNIGGKLRQSAADTLSIPLPNGYVTVT